jgi:hypothetical protein
MNFSTKNANFIGNEGWNYLMVYVDDILIFSSIFDEHKQHLNEILLILHNENQTSH